MPVYRVINYTDYHDVDEDLRTVTNQGGFWNTWGISESAGMMCRQENYTHIYSDVFVASSNVQNIELYGFT